jgi:hypothetical protein
METSVSLEKREKEVCRRKSFHREVSSDDPPLGFSIGRLIPKPIFGSV